MRNRNLQLDLLRCLAIVGVLAAHTVHFYDARSWWDRLLIRPGWTGVDLFFVLSGFLISGLLFSEFQKRGRINFPRFAIRRALKLYPMLYVLVFGVLAYRLAKYGFEESSINVVLHDVFFLQSYFPGTYGHFWSLAVEEHFYILLPVMLYFMLRRAASGDQDPFRKLPLIFLIVAALSVGIRLVHAMVVQPYHYLTHLFPTHLRLDSLFFGVFISYFHYFHAEKFRAVTARLRPFLFPLSALLILPVFVLEQSNFFIYTIGLSMLYLGYGALMVGLLQLPLSTEGAGGGFLKLVSYIGQHSYPIYLFHLMILERLLKAGFLRTSYGMLLYFVSTIAIGILLSKLIEFPVLRLRDRLFPAEAAPALAPDRRTAIAREETPVRAGEASARA